MLTMAGKLLPGKNDEGYSQDDQNNPAHEGDNSDGTLGK